jgi:hypothetical protein
MATREIGASLANYSREFSEANHIFLKNGLWRVSASPRKTAWRMSGSLASTRQASWRMLAQARMIR